MDKKKIVFLIGAGAEGNGQLGMPSGLEFKKDIFLCKDVKELIEILNNYQMSNGKLFDKRSTSILYQALKEDGGVDAFGFNEKDKEIAINYLNYKNQESAGGNPSDDFKKLFEAIIDEMTNSDVEKWSQPAKTLLEKYQYYSYADEKFNYLRNPKLYKKECEKVIKLYYSAFLSILTKLTKPGQNRTFNYSNNPKENRKILAKFLNDAQEEICRNVKTKESLYYNLISKLNEKHEVQVITTNYTNFAEKIIGLKSDDIAYLHGKLNLFENIETKEVKKLEEMDCDETIFPYIFVQSGVKPIVNSFQIKEYGKAIRFIEEADEFIILGYGFCSEDEHILRIIKDTKAREKTIYFMYDGNEKYHDNVNNFEHNDIVSKIKPTLLFSNYINKLIEHRK